MEFRTALPVAITAALVVASASSCGGTDDGDDLSQAMTSVSQNDLAVMVLPKSALGQEFAGLEIADYSHPLGYSSNVQEAEEDTIDPDDTGATLADAGRVRGYDLTYGDPDLSVLESRRGVAWVKTSVDLFSDDASAGLYLEKTGRDFQRLAGMKLDGGVSLEADSFQIEDVGDGAIGVRARITDASSDVDTSGTIVMFRLGRLIGFASITRADRENADEKVQRLARALATRIEAVVLGEIEESPVKLPPPA